MTRKLVCSITAIIAVVFTLVACVESIGQTTRTMSDLESAVSGLLASSAEDAFLIITISDSPDFVQMAGNGGTAELDFPQITDRQKQLRPKIEEVCADLGLVLRVIRSPNGMEFLDFDLPSDAGKIAQILRRILSDVYEAVETTELVLETNGFELTTA